MKVTCFLSELDFCHSGGYGVRFVVFEYGRLTTVSDGNPHCLGGALIRSLDGKAPRIHSTAFVSEFAYVIGDVEIGEGSSVWPGAVVRADMGKIDIGRYTCVQDNSVIHGDADVVIGDRVVIGHNVLCHAKTVGDGVLIGSGATVNDGVEIGEGSLVASGAMVIENMDIPACSMVVGVPARVKGEVAERHNTMIKKACDVYIQKARHYMSQDELESARDN